MLKYLHLFSINVYKLPYYIMYIVIKILKAQLAPMIDSQSKNPL